MSAKKVLLIIDVQKDFCEGGALAVKNADDIVPVINELIAKGNYDLVIASKDWHPPDHCSFAPDQIGTAHCVQDTDGAQLHPKLNTAGIQFIVHKGMDKDIECASALSDARGQPTGLDEYIRKHAGEDAQVHVCGLVTSRCVKLSALDVRRLLPNAQVTFIEDASRGGRIESTIKATREMESAGIRVAHSQELLGAVPAAAVKR